MVVFAYLIFAVALLAPQVKAEQCRTISEGVMTSKTSQETFYIQAGMSTETFSVNDTRDGNTLQGMIVTVCDDAAPDLGFKSFKSFVVNRNGNLSQVIAVAVTEYY